MLGLSNTSAPPEKRTSDEKRFVFLILFGGGIISGLCFLFLQSYLAWISLVPLFYALEKANKNQVLWYGASYGAVTASVLYYWIFPISIRYAGGVTVLTFVLFLVAVAFFALSYCIFGAGYRIIRNRARGGILTGCSAAAFYALLDFLKLKILPGIPWVQYSLAHTQAQSLWAIQLASVGGVTLIVFFIVLFNYLLAQFFIQRQVVFLRLGAGVALLFFGTGFFLSGTNDEAGYDSFKVSILNENLPAETRWDDQSGDSLVQVFFRLNGEAAAQKPDLIMWSETAVPWRFEPDDHFVPEVLKITHPSNADHLLGILTPSSHDPRMVYNSAYHIKGDGRIVSRYDKTILLDFLEKPFVNSRSLMLPFLNSSVYDNFLPGGRPHPMQSGKARFGVLICNESLTQDYWHYVDAGANLLVVMSNDAWLDQTPLPQLHFSITRFLAIATGRDVVINSNRGVSGVIHRNGKIEVSEPSHMPRIIDATAHLSFHAPFYSSVRDFNIIFYFVVVFIPVFSRRNRL